jgi:hypothetical protein
MKRKTSKIKKKVVCGGKKHKTNTNDVAKVRKETRFFFKNEWAISLNKQNKGEKTIIFLFLLVLSTLRHYYKMWVQFTSPCSLDQ